MRKLLVALLILVPISIWAQTGPGGGTGPLFDPGSGGGATEEVTGYVQPTNDGVGRWSGLVNLSALVKSFKTY